jgi:hypothetical protein
MDGKGRKKGRLSIMGQRGNHIGNQLERLTTLLLK